MFQRHLFGLAIVGVLAGMLRAEELVPTSAVERNPPAGIDTEALVLKIKRGTPAESKAAAEALVKAGKIDEIRAAFAATWHPQNLVAREAIRSQGDLIVPALAKRLKNTDEDRDIFLNMGALQHPAATPILLHRLAKTRDTFGSAGNELSVCLVDALTRIRDPLAIPELKARFADTSSKLMKIRYAFALLVTGDSTGLVHLKGELAEDVRRDAPSLVTELLDIYSEEGLAGATPEALAELLPGCIQAVGRKQWFLRLHAKQALVRMTHYNFGDDVAAWENWFQRHHAKHPIWIGRLDRASRQTATRFLDAFIAAGATHPEIEKMLFGRPNVEFTWCGQKSMLGLYWVDSKSHAWRFSSIGIPAPPAPAEEYQTLLSVRFVDGEDTASFLRETPKEAALVKREVLFTETFKSLNVVVELSSGTTDAATKAKLKEIAKDAIIPLATYAKSYKAP